MLHGAELPIEFWDEAAMASAYLKNRVPTGPVTNEKAVSPEQVWAGKSPSIDHVRVWGCKCFAKVNPDSHPSGTRQDKLMPVGREAVLMGFDPETTKQYRIHQLLIRNESKRQSNNLMASATLLRLYKRIFLQRLHL